MDKIKENIRKWVSDSISKDFEFREMQEDIIANIVASVIYDDTSKKNHIIEAPTGSGKSIIVIVAAGVLAHYYNRTSYILCSDLFLWEQYDAFINKHSEIKKQIASIKGQTGNYICNKNHEDLRNGECRIEGVSWKSLMRSMPPAGYQCARFCKYVKARKRAVQSRVCLMTYQCLLYQLNRDSNSVDTNPDFTDRDVLFCDECHNIPTICSGKFSPTFRKGDIEHLSELYKDMYAPKDLFNTVDENIDILYRTYPTLQDMQKECKKLYKELCNENLDAYSNTIATERYTTLFELFASHVTNIEEDCKEQKKLTGVLTKENIARYKHCSWYHNMMCYMHDFMNAAIETGYEYTVKNVTEDKEHNKIVSIYCCKEDYIINKFLLSHGSYRVMLSATVGMKEAFDDNIGIKYSDEPTSYMERIPSTFDFSQSPVIYYGKYKMSMKDKDVSFPILKDMIYKLLKRHAGQKGIIQTGSYANAKAIIDGCPENLKKRLLVYDSAAEKGVVIKHHNMCNDTVLIGPTLTEGIDLPDDGCRFIIILKVPYPMLTDKLVQAKMKLFPLWYESETSNAIIQGIGRGNRNPTDYCTTYILDGCFGYLYYKTSKQYAPELQQRIKTVM